MVPAKTTRLQPSGGVLSSWPLKSIAPSNPKRPNPFAPSGPAVVEIPMPKATTVVGSARPAATTLAADPAPLPPVPVMYYPGYPTGYGMVGVGTTPSVMPAVVSTAAKPAAARPPVVAKSTASVPGTGSPSTGGPSNGLAGSPQPAPTAPDANAAAQLPATAPVAEPSAPAAEPSIAAQPQPPASPTALAEATEIQGFVQMGDRINILVKDPQDSISRTLQVGDAFAGGKVRLRRIDTKDGQPPQAIFEQNGIEISRPVGG